MRISYSNIFTENNKLSYLDIERFKSLMIGDKVMLDCDEVISEVTDESKLIDCLVYMWQQHSSTFRKNLPREIKDWFLTKFENTVNEVYYKGMHFKQNSDMSLDVIDFTSVTSDYEIAVEFAYGINNNFKDNNYICAVYRVYGTRIFKGVNSSRDMGEKEFIIHNPRFELLEILK